MENMDIIQLMNDPNVQNIIRGTYEGVKSYLKEEFQNMDDDEMISYAKAYIINEYNKITNKYEKKNFMLDVVQGYRIIEGMDNFIKSMNGTTAKMGELVRKDVVDELKELENYKYTDVYKILSKDNKKIAEYHGYVSIKRLKKNAEESNGKKSYFEYILSKEEINIIENTKKYYIPNQIAHMLFDEKLSPYYSCDHTIYNEKEVLKNLLVSTNENSPRYDIVFEDGRIVEYNMGDIRVKPYTFKQVVEYTKLYMAKNFYDMLEYYENPINTLCMNTSTPEQKGRQMLINSYTYVLGILTEYEDIYTQKMIDDAKEDLIKMKETAKQYHL